MTTAEPSASEVFAVDLAQLAREIAMDIFPLADVLRLHQLDDEEWLRIQDNPRFKAMVEQMVREWNSAGSTRERIRIKASTGLESVLETYILAIADDAIPLTQRVEAGKFLARIGEIEGGLHEGGGAQPFAININIGADVHHQLSVQPRPIIDVTPIIPEDDE